MYLIEICQALHDDNPYWASCIVQGWNLGFPLFIQLKKIWILISSDVTVMISLFVAKVISPVHMYAQAQKLGNCYSSAQMF